MERLTELIEKWWSGKITAKDVFRPETILSKEAPTLQWSINPKYLDQCHEEYQELYWLFDEAVSNNMIEIKGTFIGGGLEVSESGPWLANGNYRREDGVRGFLHSYENWVLRGSINNLIITTSPLYTWKEPTSRVDGWVKTQHSIYRWSNKQMNGPQR